MRTILGYIFILMLVPFLYILLVFSVNEWTHAQSVEQLLDKKVNYKSITIPQTSYMTDDAGKIISEISNAERRIYLSQKDIPEFLKQLFITIEDRSFYQHSGVDALAIGRAILVNSKHDSFSQGGSTITQQLARNLYLTQEKTYNRKLTELLYSWQLEKKLTKSEILELYINAIYYQNGSYGIEAASQFYYSKPLKQLSKAEIAYLAAIPNNPTLYNPLTHYQLTKKRQERILQQMLQANKLSKAEYQTAIHEKIKLDISKPKSLYPDYTVYALQEFSQLVAQSEGLSEKLKSHNSKTRKEANEKLSKKVKLLLQSGITIHTALDPSIQKRARQSVQMRLAGSEAEGAAAVIQHNTHRLVSLIGGKNYKINSFNRAYQSFRQPGSAIKPLLVYAPYFEDSHATTADRVSGANYCKNGYCPKNYTRKSYGMVTIKKAFAESYNTPAIRLFEKNGIERSFRHLEPFHFKEVTAADHRLTAAVGGFAYGMSPLELTDAYTSFTDGTYQPARAITSVTDKSGKTLYRWNDHSAVVWNGDTVRKMRELLHEVIVDGTAKKAYIPSSYIGGKTGTTNGVKDMWFVGLTEDYTTGVWVGKDRPAGLAAIQPSAPHLMIWKDINKLIKSKKGFE
ncbi:transglycosylase domain-containing protein [Peribacillus sp. B-H-3]|uniref:transglycosylase domain-containing protein n=1 Tax=Peribacillus sp. B-H-3 TaxID=3400420 RepID=UPI003B01DA86